MSKETDQQLVETTFNDFEKNLRLLRDFGVQALKNSLNQKLQGQAQTFKLGDQEVISLFGTSATDREIDNVISQSGLDRVQKLLHLENVPRYDTDPDLENKKVLGNEPSRTSQNVLPNPLLAKLMGDAADPKVRQGIFNKAATAIDEFNRTRQWTPQLDNAIKNALELELKLRAANRMRLTPTYTPPKPRPNQ